MGRIVVAICVMLAWAQAASATDLRRFFREKASPICGVAEITDFMWTACDWDAQIRAEGNCHIEVPVFKTVRFQECVHVSHGPLRRSEIVVRDSSDELMLSVIDALSLVDWPEPPDTTPWGDYMPAGSCREMSEELGALWNSSNFRVIDEKLPGWRDCMYRLAEAVRDNLHEHPTIQSLNKLNSLIMEMDLGASTGEDAVLAFVIAMEDEQQQPVPIERVLELLSTP